MLRTKNCIFCYNSEPNWSGGHVHKLGEIIIAKVCSNPECQNKWNQESTECQGCYGEWNKNMGIDTGSELFYIDSNGLYSIDEDE